MIKVTLDTNILISASFWTGDSFKIMELVENGKIICVLSKEIISEYQKVLKSEEIIEKVEKKELIVSKVIQKVLGMCELADPHVKLDVVKDDPEDNKIIECAFAAKSDFIITSDNHLLKLREYQRIKIVTPSEFLISL